MNQQPRKSTRDARGFTLIETLIVMALIVIIAALGVPSLRDFAIRNKVASLGNEFSGALQQARALAVSRNSCVSVCVAAASNGTTCIATTVAGADFQATGWITFQNPACNATQTSGTASGATIFKQRTGEASSGYTLVPSATDLNIILFDPRGYANVSTATGTFLVTPPGTDTTQQRRICIDAAGRASVRKASSTC